MQLTLSEESARRLGNLVWRSTLALAGTTVAAGLGLTWFGRWKVRGLQSHPDPAYDYDDALRRLGELQAGDGDDVNAVCRSRGLLHGHKTERAIILVHGLTSCPQQFARLGEAFFERGYNVLLPRMPRHGLADRMTTELGHLRAEELRTFGDAVVDIAAGLGDAVTVAGLSAGGIVTAWAAQYRAELAKAVMISPALGLGSYGSWLQLLFMEIVLSVPDIPTQRFSKVDSAMPYAYVGWSSRALGEVLRLGLATARAAVRKPPATQHLIVVTNANDAAVNSQITRQLVTLWQSHGLRRVEYYEFERDLKLEHDLVDPNNPRQRVDVVYPVLLDLITRS
jgi:alpha-beta hydrolase superfamily lysophospholipase